MHGAQNTCLNACHTPRKKLTCTRACVSMQRRRNFFAMETVANLSWVLREHRASCRLPPTLPLSRVNQSPDAVRSRNTSKSTLAHDAVAAAVSHKHHSIVRVGAGLIQFVYGSHSRLAADLILQMILFPLFFSWAFLLYSSPKKIWPHLVSKNLRTRSCVQNPVDTQMCAYIHCHLSAPPDHPLWLLIHSSGELENWTPRNY